MPDAALSIDCGGPYPLTPENTASCWEAEPTSPAEVTILSYCSLHPEFYADKRLFHIGIGNSAVPIALVAGLRKYVGLTISAPELARLNRCFADEDKAFGFLGNKYDVASLQRVVGEFDLIVDTLLKSVACCEKHFDEMMRFFAARLARGGAIVTTRNGVEFGWRCDLQRAHTPGAQIDPEVAEGRVLGMPQLLRLAGSLGLKVEAETKRPAGVDNPRDDQVLLLKKP